MSDARTVFQWADDEALRARKATAVSRASGMCYVAGGTPQGVAFKTVTGSRELFFKIARPWGRWLVISFLTTESATVTVKSAATKPGLVGFAYVSADGVNPDLVVLKIPAARVGALSTWVSFAFSGASTLGIKNIAIMVQDHDAPPMGLTADYTVEDGG